MSFKIFKNSKAARRHLSKVYLNIHAVDKHLKPCYLWDSFTAKPEEVRSYLDQLQQSGDVDEHLCVIVVMDTIFVAHLENLESHLYEICVNNDTCIVDVSENRNPVLLSSDRAEEVLKSIYENVRRLLLRSNSFWEQNSAQSGPWLIEQLECELEKCNMTTLFGAFLGYPVLYWYERHKPSDVQDSGNCLSMVPLRVYCVISRVEHSKESSVLKRPIPLQHELFSFSIPEVVSEYTSKPVDAWYKNLCSRCDHKCLFLDIQLVHKTVVLPSVAM